MPIRKDNDAEEQPQRCSRRQFLAETGALTATVAVAAPLLSGCYTVIEESPPPVAFQNVSDLVNVRLHINGQEHQLQLEPRVTLLDLLRDRLALTGAKKGCDHGQCGACTVLVNGRRVISCLTLAVMHEGAEITTIEGLAHGGQLSPLQTAFIKHDGFQCGFCTSGQICSATAMLAEAQAGALSSVAPHRDGTQPVLTDDEIRERMSGNLCRCGAYNGIVAAIREVHDQGNA